MSANPSAVRLPTGPVCASGCGSAVTYPDGVNLKGGRVAHRACPVDVLAALGLVFTARPSKRTAPDGFKDSTPWSVTLRKTDGTGRRLTVPFYMGSGHGGKAPDASSVLDCLASDASLCADGFATFCGETVLDTDSRTAERKFRACRRQTDRLKALLGETDFERVVYGDLQDAIRGA